MRHDLVLDGHGVTLRPLEPADAPALASIIDAELWAGMSSAVPRGVPGAEAEITQALDAIERQPFAVVEQASREVVGSTSYYELSETQRRVEIGYTFYDRRCWGGRTNPVCKLLLLEQAFDRWGLARVALRCDIRNTRSAAAIERLGAVREGVLRSHRTRPDGSRGDTVYFSVIAEEWPAVRRGLEARLA
jgi:RimJ/RimL family protein N-acetyltransferase